MKEWPKTGTVRFSDIVDPLRAVADKMYKLKRLPLADIKYDGYNRGEQELGGCLDVDYQLSAEMLRYDDEDQGRDAMRVLLGIAVSLGVEQGRRAYVESSAHQILLLKLETVRAAVERGEA